ncbi:MAG: tellurium resistance protein TerC [Flavobacteriales bacterium]|nr:tellurium resistance protein TerC [Flavobacteriales bacterium]
MAQDLLTLIMLILLQAVLGFDNLLYISLESKRAPKEKQAMVRGWGIGLAMVLRIILLFVLVNVIKYFQEPILPINWGNFMTANFNIHGLIVVIGGAFIIYTAMKEIWHMLRMPEHEELDAGKKKSVGQVITLIVIMNLVFSFDSILSALALTNVFWVMATAIIIGGLLMIWLSGKVSEFLEKNRMYEVLGLFILFVVGIMLLTEGGEIGKLHFFGKPGEHMEKTTFYFVVTVLVLMELVQSGYKKNLERKARKRAGKDG